MVLSGRQDRDRSRGGAVPGLSRLGRWRCCRTATSWLTSFTTCQSGRTNPWPTAASCAWKTIRPDARRMTN